jgi:hypothetical protein
MEPIEAVYPAAHPGIPRTARELGERLSVAPGLAPSRTFPDKVRKTAVTRALPGTVDQMVPNETTLDRRPSRPSSGGQAGQPSRYPGEGGCNGRPQ